jgi:hypothetical protein
MKKQMLVSLFMLSSALVVEGVMASDVTGLTIFAAGTPIRAAEVNGNFSVVKTAVDDNYARIGALTAAVATLQATVATLQTNLTSANNTIAALNTKLASVSNITVNGQPTVRFSGVNVQVVNGQGATATANGTGNLVVGYDETESSSTNRCTLGTNPSNGAIVVDAVTCSDAGGTWTNSGFKTGSHYVVAGSGNNYSRWGGVVFGYRNTSNYNYASVSGGIGNTAGGTHASVSGGANNIANGDSASVSGGIANTASHTGTSVSGGDHNTASGDRASVSGGIANTASHTGTSVSGGWNNTASSHYANVSGGQNNAATGQSSNVSGGAGNTASGAFASVLGSVGQNASTYSQTIPALP